MIKLYSFYVNGILPKQEAPNLKNAVERELMSLKIAFTKQKQLNEILVKYIQLGLTTDQIKAMDDEISKL